MPFPDKARTAMNGDPIDLLVCIKCRRELDIPEDGTRPGAALHKALTGAALPDNVRLKAVECLSNCSSGCSIALRGGPGRWTYVYGNLLEDSHVETVVEGVRAYAGTADGIVPWRERPEHFRKNCIARIPPQEV
jgi:predicted metal-binding protein